jgi:hypothetical protein
MAGQVRFVELHHVGVEVLHLRGKHVGDRVRELRADQFVWRPAGSRHHAWAGPQGGLFLAIFLAPNKFFNR